VGAILLVLVVAVGILAWGPGRKVIHPIKYGEIVEKWAAEYGVDPLLIFAVIQTESGFDPEAESNVGARGLMQVMDDTFDWIKGRIAPDEALTFDDMYDPETAIRFGTYLYAISLQRYGNDVSTAAASYHSGWGTVDGLLEDTAYSADGVTLHTFPYNQMQNYVNKINRNYETYKDLYGGSAATGQGSDNKGDESNV